MDRALQRKTLRGSRMPLWRSAAVFAALISFFLQSYIVQTHIHEFGEAPFSFTLFMQNNLEAPAQAIKATSGKIARHDKAPDNDDPDHCPFCQAIALAGHFVTPVAAVLVLPLEAPAIVLVNRATSIAHEIFSHSWLGRAPPRN